MIKGYLSRDGETVTDAKGIRLAVVTELKPAGHNQITDGNYYTFRARGPDGATYYGRGGLGLAVNLHPRRTPE